MLLVLLGALLTTFIVSVNSDQSLIATDRDQNRAYYGAQAGLEKLTADIGSLFETNFQPTPAQINALATTPPTLAGISFVRPGGGSGYQIQFTTNAQGRVVSNTLTVPSGPYAGLIGQVEQYTMTSTARSLTGSEVQMQRQLQSVFVPVFQFGVFSETDLSFFAGPPMNFGGRVHTNSNLYVAEGNGNTLTLSDKVTALGEVIRTNLSNGWDTNTNYTGTVSMAKAPGVYRNLGRTEGSLVGTIGSGQNEPTWTNLSIGTYNGYIRNSRTGATRLTLPLVSAGGSPIDLIRRPAANELADNPALLAWRYFSRASMRILLSDTAAQITSLPRVTLAAPVRLAPPTNPTAPDGTFFAVAGTAANGYRATQDTTGMLDGYIKIEIQTAVDVWQDVTNEILGLGINGHNLTGATACVDSPDAVIRLQRFKDNPATCDNTNGKKYWPLVLYDPREGALRDNINTGELRPFLGGVMHYVELDVNNLGRYFRGAIGATGPSAMIRPNGYVVYFSDRRTNQDATPKDTGEYGFEDFVNPLNINGTPNGNADTGEDVNGNSALDVYGETPVLPPGAAAPYDNNVRPWMNHNGTDVTATIARVNKPVFFRRALKLVHGATMNFGMNGAIPWGLAVACENPLYIQGDYNANGTFNGPHNASSVLADAVTLLSNNWNDINSFNSPHDPGGRNSATTWYRTAIISGKGRSFPQPANTPQDFGTDGGMHNFFRLMENWGGTTLNYRGSVISLYYNRQAVGLYKCCTNVYSPPTRGYNFDTDFLDPNLLPPDPPGFVDINITGFTRMMTPR